VTDRTGSAEAATGERAPSGIDTSRPSIARVYDYLLRGKDHFAVDRAVGDKIKQAIPEVSLGVAAQRAVLRRAVRYLIVEAGIRQLVDIGSGLPTAGNVHEVAQEVHPDVRVVYTDHDPIVLAHARALLARDDRTAVIDADLLRPEELIGHPGLRQLIDLERPVGLLLCGILHHITDEENPAELVARLCAPLPSGSHVFIHHLVENGDPGVAAAQAALRQGMGRGRFRTRDEIERMFDGLELVEPGLVPVPEWQPDADTLSADGRPVLQLALVGAARKP
jgi:O-methyltransferase involved in polyketide biosynthesis